MVAVTAYAGKGIARVLCGRLARPEMPTNEGPAMQAVGLMIDPAVPDACLEFRSSVSGQVIRRVDLVGCEVVS